MKALLWKGWKRDVGVALLLLVLHAGLRQVLVRHDVVSSVFAAGSHVPVGMLLTAAVFAVVRLAVLLVLPSYFVSRVLGVIVGWCLRRANS